MTQKKQVYARIPLDLALQIEANAKSLGVDRSVVIHAAIAKYLEQPEQIPVELRYADIERRIHDLELILRSHPKRKNG